MTTKPQLALKLVELINETAETPVFDSAKAYHLKQYSHSGFMLLYLYGDSVDPVSDMQFIYLVAICRAEMENNGWFPDHYENAIEYVYSPEQRPIVSVKRSGFDPISTAIAEAQAMIEALEQEKD